MIQACWDSDRLDLRRVGITPHPIRLCINVGNQWADGCASLRIVPTFVLEEWEIDLVTERGPSVRVQYRKS